MIDVGKEKLSVPIWEKMNLTVEECCSYSNIGRNKLNSIMKNSDCNFWFYVGSKKLVNKELFNEYIKKIAEINGSL